MNIHNESSIIMPDGIPKIEEARNAKYVMESCIKINGVWTDFPVSIFYTEEKHPNGSNYFGLYLDRDSVVSGVPKMVVADAISAIQDFKGVRLGDDVYYSRCRSDNRDFQNGYYVVGGRDFLHYGGPSPENLKEVVLRVNKDKLEVV